MRIGFVIKPGIEKVRELGTKIVAWARAQSHELITENQTSKKLGLPESGLTIEQLASQCDVLTTLGGDGTFLSAARQIGGKSPILVGINFGTLGFLTEFSPDEIFEAMEMACSNTPKLGFRSMLSVEVEREGKSIFTAQALNDAVFLKGAKDRLLELDFAVENNQVMRLRADGLIIATPTGSTAYSLAAGGSIATPDLHVALVTPICPHSLTVRPIIVGLDLTMVVSVPDYEGKVFVNVDGQSSCQLKAGDRAIIKKSPNKVRYLKSSKSSYFDILRDKLHWGIANKPA